MCNLVGTLMYTIRGYFLQGNMSIPSLQGTITVCFYIRCWCILYNLLCRNQQMYIFFCFLDKLWDTCCYHIQVSRKGGRSHERKFFLFSDMLMYAKPKLLENGLHSAYMCCCMLPLQHCRVSRVLGCGQGEGTLFTVSMVNYNESKHNWEGTAVI